MPIQAGLIEVSAKRLSDIRMQGEISQLGDQRFRLCRRGPDRLPIRFELESGAD